MGEKSNARNRKGNHDSNKGSRTTPRGILITKPIASDIPSSGTIASGNSPIPAGIASDSESTPNPANSIDGNQLPVISIGSEGNVSGGIAGTDAPIVIPGGGTEFGTGSGGSDDSRGTEPAPSGTPRKRGRHPIGCQCDKHRGQQTPQGTTSHVNVGELKSPPPPKEGAQIFDFFANPGVMSEQARKSIGVVWEGIYQLPILAGYGAYWALKEDETKRLTEQSINLLGSIPAKHKKQILEMFNTWGPVTAFMSTVLMITYPRFLMTKAQIAQGTTNANNRTNGETKPNGNTESSNQDSTNHFAGTPQREHPFANLVSS